MYNVLALTEREHSIFDDTVGSSCEIVSKSDGQSLTDRTLCLIHQIFPYLILVFYLLLFNILFSVFLKQNQNGLQISLNSSNCIRKGMVIGIFDSNWKQLLFLLHHVGLVLLRLLEYLGIYYVHFVLFLQIDVAYHLVAKLEQLFTDLFTDYTVLEQYGPTNRPNVKLLLVFE